MTQNKRIMKAQQFNILLAGLLLMFCYESTSQDFKRRLTIDDIINFKKILEPQISPDGEWIAYTVTEVDLQNDKSETRIWMVSANGGDPIPMTAKGYSDTQPRWSPDNKYLSFLTTKSVKEEPQVWTLNRLGGEATKITNIKQGVLGHEWSPDGKRLVLIVRDPKPEELTEDIEDDKKPIPIVVDRLQFKRDYQGYLNRYRKHLYIFTLGDSAAIKITSGDFDDSDPVWSPDGKSIAFVSNRTDNPDGNFNTDIWIVSAENENLGKPPLQLTHSPNQDWSPEWSPDGNYIAYITKSKNLFWYATNYLATVPVAGGQPSLLTERVDRNVNNPKFSSDGQTIYFILEENGTSIIASVDASGKTLKRVISGNISIIDYSIYGSLISPLLSRDQEPGDIFIHENDQLKRLTNINGNILNSVKKASLEKILFKSKDGTQVEGFIIKPPGFDPSTRYPAILWIHGGPVDQYEYGSEFNEAITPYFYSGPILFAANGYVSILINPRGSSGYGQAYAEAIFADWGNKDYQDVIAGVDYVIDQGYVDSNRLGVGGWSYGGILTNYIITKTDRFKGAISGASEALYRSNYGHDHYQLSWEMELGLPWENAEAWESISPFNQVAKITTPTLWMGGSDDWNCPILNSEQMYQAMKRLGKETQLVVYPGEHHKIQRPSFNKDMLERFVQWYDKYVK